MPDGLPCAITWCVALAPSGERYCAIHQHDPEYGAPGMEEDDDREGDDENGDVDEA